MAKVGDIKQIKRNNTTEVWKLVAIESPSRLAELKSRLVQEEQRDVDKEYERIQSDRQENIRVLKKEIKRLTNG